MGRETGDVLHLLRTRTAAEHESVERSLDLLDPALDRSRLVDVLTRLHGFWLAAEDGLDGWAMTHPREAEEVRWSRRRRARLYADDLAALGTPSRPPRPRLPPVDGTDEALGRLYVLEGSTLGGTFIDRHLATMPGLTGARLRAFSPYGPETAAMWHAFRRTTRARIAGGGHAAVVVGSARETFQALAAWCEPVARTDATIRG
jgi:heme oxygenase